MKRTIFTVIFLMTVLFSVSFADNPLYVKDINSDLKVGLQELIVQLQVLSGFEQEYSESITMDSAKIVVVRSSSLIQGSVIEDTGNLEIFKPIPNANVVCATQNGQVFSITSDDKGFFMFDNMPAGIHSVKAFKEGFESSEIMVDLADNQKAELILKLRLTEQKPGGIQGKILTPNASGQLMPVQGAIVKLLPVPDDFSVQTQTARNDATTSYTPNVETDINGYYIIEAVANGRYFVIANHDGFRLSMSIVTITTGNLVTADLVIFPKNEKNFGSLLGTVVEQKNDTDSLWSRFAPVQNATVTLSIEENGTVKDVRKTITGQKGEFYFAGIAIGSYILNITHENFEAYRQAVVIKDDDPNSLPIIQPVPIESTSNVSNNSVTNDPTAIARLMGFMTDSSNTCFCIGPYGTWVPNATFVKVILQRKTSEQQVSLSGKVITYVEGTLKSIVGAKVTISPYFPYPTFAALPSFTTVSDETGYYKFEKLPVGYPINGQIVYLISAVAQGFQDMSGRVILNSDSETTFDIKMASNPMVIMLKGHVYDGSVKCDDLNKCTKPIINAVIYLLNETASRDTKAVTDETGLYVFERLAVGKYKMVVNALGYFTVTDSVEVGVNLENVKDIYMMPKTDVSVIQGQVTHKPENCNLSDCSKPVVGATVVLSPPVYASWPQLKVLTDETGKFAFKDVIPGTYQMIVRAAGLATWESSVTVEAGKELVQNVELTTVSDAGRLKGTITVFCDNTTNATNVSCTKPIEGALIELLPMSYDTAGDIVTPLRTKSDSNGNYFFESVFAGKYRIAVTFDGYYPREDYIGIVPNDEIVYNVNLISVSAKSRISGTIYLSDITSDGVKRIGAYIPVMLLSSSFQLRFETKSDQNGVYVFENVPNEIYTLYVKKESYMPFEMKLDLSSNNEIIQDIILMPIANMAFLKGYVTDGLVDCGETATDCIVPIAGALIVIKPQIDSNNVGARETKTNERGFYEIDNIALGKYTLWVGAKSYEPKSKDIEIVQGENAENIELIPATVCFDSTGCSSKEYCAKVQGACKSEGVCLAKPDICPMFVDPVCGCDGQTYANACLATGAGVNVAFKGSCDNIGQTGNISGKITDSLKALPLVGADVHMIKIEETTGQVIDFYVVSDDQGLYNFQKVPVGWYYLVVKYQGYQSFKDKVEIIANMSSVKDVGLMPLQTTSTLSGLVLSSVCQTATNCVIANAKVVLISQDTTNSGVTTSELSTQTNSEGYYEFANLTSGAYVMLVNAQGFSTFKEIIKIQPGIDNVKDIKLQPTNIVSTLSGYVYDMAMNCDPVSNICPKGIANAKLVLYPTGYDTSEPIVTALTDAKGYYAMSNVPVGIFRLTVDTEGFVAFETKITIVQGQNTYDVRLLKEVVCKDNSVCNSDSFCAKPLGDCSSEGACLIKPQACLMLYDPVCGCDNKTYSNDCIANGSGVNVQYKGKCI